jgi:hypothetical protein
MEKGRRLNSFVIIFRYLLGNLEAGEPTVALVALIEIDGKSIADKGLSWRDSFRVLAFGARPHKQHCATLKVHPRGKRDRAKGRYSRLLALILAKEVAPSANRRVMTAAVSGKRRGSHTVGCSGQTILITAGMSAGWTKTTSMVSPDVLIVPLASGVMG